MATEQSTNSGGEKVFRIPRFNALLVQGDLWRVDPEAGGEPVSVEKYGPCQYKATFMGGSVVLAGKELAGKSIIRKGSVTTEVESRVGHGMLVVKTGPGETLNIFALKGIFDAVDPEAVPSKLVAEFVSGGDKDTVDTRNIFFFPDVASETIGLALDPKIYKNLAMKISDGEIDMADLRPELKKQNIPHDFFVKVYNLNRENQNWKELKF